MQSTPSISRSALAWHPARRRLVGSLLWTPLYAVALAIALFAFVTFHYDRIRLDSRVIVLIVMMLVLSLIAIALYALGVIVVGRDIAQRQDMRASDKQSWLLILFIAGPFGPPLYWQRYLRADSPPG